MPDQMKLLLSGFLIGAVMVLFPPLMIPLCITYLGLVILWDDHGIEIERVTSGFIPESIFD